MSFVKPCPERKKLKRTNIKKGCNILPIVLNLNLEFLIEIVYEIQILVIFLQSSLIAPSGYCEIILSKN